MFSAPGKLERSNSTANVLLAAAGAEDDVKPERRTFAERRAMGESGGLCGTFSERHSADGDAEKRPTLQRQSSALQMRRDSVARASRDSSGPGKIGTRRNMAARLSQSETESLEDKPIGDAEAVAIAATLGIKGRDFLSCDPVQFADGDNIMSIAYAPKDASDAAGHAWVAWEDGTGDSWRPAACAPYVRIDFARWWA